MSEQNLFAIRFSGDQQPSLQSFKEEEEYSLKR